MPYLIRVGFFFFFSDLGKEMQKLLHEIFKLMQFEAL